MDLNLDTYWPIALQLSYTIASLPWVQSEPPKPAKDIRLLIPKSNISARMVETPEFARRILSGENKKWEMTFCSATVQKTAEEIFGIILPRGNPIQILPEYRWEKLSRTQAQRVNPFSETTFKTMIQSYSLVDVITRSPSRPHIKHRFLIFSTLSGERYVIDPYIPVNGKKTRSPIQLNEYLKTIYGMGYLPVGMRGYGGKWGVI